MKSKITLFKCLRDDKGDRVNYIFIDSLEIDFNEKEFGNILSYHDSEVVFSHFNGSKRLQAGFKQSNTLVYDIDGPRDSKTGKHKGISPLQFKRLVNRLNIKYIIVSSKSWTDSNCTFHLILPLGIDINDLSVYKELHKQVGEKLFKSILKEDDVDYAFGSGVQVSYTHINRRVKAIGNGEITVDRIVFMKDIEIKINIEKANLLINPKKNTVVSGDVSKEIIFNNYLKGLSKGKKLNGMRIEEALRTSGMRRTAAFCMCQFAKKCERIDPYDVKSFILNNMRFDPTGSSSIKEITKTIQKIIGV